MTVDLREYKSDITSQYGENGIIRKIFDTIGPSNRICIEFGAYDLQKDSNVFPLWSQEGWTAILIEHSRERANAIENDYKAWCAAHATAGSMVLLRSHVEPTGPKSLDSHLASLGIPNDPDVCVIDVDGMDYHIFAHLSAFTPRVVMCEFNPTIPPHLAIVPNSSGNRLGCSARALTELARQKGYSLVACTKVNGIFVREDLAAPFAHRDDLDLLFDPYAITYLMTAYDGSVFLSTAPFFQSNLLSGGAKHDLVGDDRFWIPSARLTSSYLLSRALFNWIARLSPRLADAALMALRRFRRATGSRLLVP